LVINMERALEGYIQHLLDSAEYKRYACIRDKVKEYPELKARIDDFRMKNFELQRSDNAFDMLERFEHEYEALLEEPLVLEFLDAELAFCRMMQQNNNTIMRAIHFE